MVRLHHHIVNLISRLWSLKYPETDFIVFVKESESTYGSWLILSQVDSSHFLTAYNQKKRRKEVRHKEAIKCRFATRQDGNAATL